MRTRALQYRQQPSCSAPKRQQQLGSLCQQARPALLLQWRHCRDQGLRVLQTRGANSWQQVSTCCPSLAVRFCEGLLLSAPVEGCCSARPEELLLCALRL